MVAISNNDFCTAERKENIMNSRTYAAYAAMKAHQRGQETQDGIEKCILRIPPHKVILAKEPKITILEPRHRIDVRA